MKTVSIHLPFIWLLLILFILLATPSSKSLKADTVLSPVPQSHDQSDKQQAVPEPASLLLLGSGLIAFIQSVTHRNNNPI